MTSEGRGGVLRIIDLAGSERASKTTFEGGDFFQRRQEAININKTVCILYIHLAAHSMLCGYSMHLTLRGS